MESYRPISLINQDSKIFTSILANGLNSFVGNYIHENENGFIKGRQMADLVRRVLNTMHVARMSKCTAGSIALDVFKVFNLNNYSYRMQQKY